mgnify:CR=1 FL=1
MSNSRFITFLLFGALLLCAPVPAQEWAKEKLAQSPRHLEWVTVTSGDREIETYVAYPENAKKATTVLVIHEIFGLNDNIRDITRRFAEQGYAALAVDLYSGGGNRALCVLRVFAGLMARPLNNRGLGDLQRAVDWLQARPEVDAGHIGAVGFCMGGGYALGLACVDGDVRAASVFYGQAPRPLSTVARACPIVGSYPANDPMTRGDAVKLERALEQFGVPHDIVVYPGAQHSFFNDQGPTYQPEAAADSWRRTLAFFAQHLRPSSGPEERSPEGWLAS